jgi:hypothetical protein
MQLSAHASPTMPLLLLLFLLSLLFLLLLLLLSLAAQVAGGGVLPLLRSKFAQPQDIFVVGFNW